MVGTVVASVVAKVVASVVLDPAAVVDVTDEVDGGVVVGPGVVLPSAATSHDPMDRQPPVCAGVALPR